MRPHSSRARIVLVLIGAAGLAACGSSGSSSGSGDTSATTARKSGASKQSIDVCKIVTAADAQKVVGGPVQQQAPSGTEGLASGVCIYKGTGGGIRVNLLQVRVYPGPQFYGEKALPGAKSIDIPGTDKAFVRSSAQGRNVDVQFVKDGKTGAVNYTDTQNTDESGTVTAVENVAETLAAGI